MQFARDQLNRLASGKRMVLSTQKQQGGCYVATAVYGSYDCPEVWALRRFRDEFLLAHRGGSTAVRIYYALGRMAVRYGGNSLRRAARRPLDWLVEVLRKRSYSEAPYDD